MKECPICRCCFADRLIHCRNEGAALVPTIAGDGVLDGRYELKKRLGQGGMGSVYEARHSFLKTTHAVKVISPEFLEGHDPEFVRRFRQEAMAAANIRHRNVIRVTDFGVANGTMPFLVMDFIRGVLLHHILTGEKVLPPERALEIIEPVALGVEAAHKLGIVHRDLKPLNIIIEDGLPLRDAVKVLDFGLAKIKAGELLGSFVAAKSSGVMGSPFYMAPEQWSDAEFDARTDIYSLGIILYQMLAGDVPFKGPSAPSIMKKHLMDEPPRFGELGASVHPRIEAVVRRALQKDPDQRPESARAFVEELREAVEEAAVHRLAQADATWSDALAHETLEVATPSGRHDSDAETIPHDSGAGGQESERDRRFREELDRAAAEARRRAEEEWLRREEEERLRREEEERLRREEEERLRREEEARLKSEAEARRKLEEERLRREEEERLKREEAERLKREEEERRRKEEERRRKEEEARRREEEERQRLAEEERKRKELEEQKRKEEEERLRALEEARQRAAEEARQRAAREEERKRRAAEEAQRQAAEERRREEARLAAEAAARQRAEEERLLREEEERLKREEEERLRREEEERLKREEEERLKREDEERLRREEDERLRREEAERLKRAEEARLKREEADRLKREEEENRRREEEARAKREEAERLRLAEEARRQREADERLQREAEGRRRQEEFKRREEAARERAEVEAARQQQEEEAAARAAGAQRFAQAPDAVQAGDTHDDTLGVNTGAAERNRSALLALAAGLVLLMVFAGVFVYFSLGTREQSRPPQENRADANTPAANRTGSAAAPQRGAAADGRKQPPKPDMVEIAGGSFMMGQSNVPDLPGTLTQYPAHPVTVAPFRIDRTEVTNGEYADFVRETGNTAPEHWNGMAPPAGMEKLPVVNVSFHDAQAFAQWRSNRDGVTYRLPREEEWEFAARGPGNNLFPWGNAWVDDRANLEGKKPSPVGSYPQGAAERTGVLDLIGNVWEWTSSESSLYPGNDKLDLEGKGWIVVRGGSYASMNKEAVKKRGGRAFPTTLRQWLKKETRDETLGFRLVRPLP